MKESTDDQRKLPALRAGVRKAATVCNMPEKRLYAAIGLTPDGTPITTVEEAKTAFGISPLFSLERGFYLRKWLSLCTTFIDTIGALRAAREVGSCESQMVIFRMIELCSNEEQFQFVEFQSRSEDNPALHTALYSTIAHFYTEEEEFPFLEEEERLACVG